MTRHSMHYGDLLGRAARMWPDRPALSCGDEHLTFAEFEQRARAIAAELNARGLTPGTALVDIRGNDLLSVLTDFGCALAYVIRVAVDPRLSDDDIRHILQDSRAKAVLLAPGLEERSVAWGLDTAPVQTIRDAELPTGGADGPPLPRPDGDPVLAYRYTGGTTGRPKGVRRSHAEQMWVATNMLSELMPLGADDLFLHTQPMSKGAYNFVLPCIMAGARQIVLPSFDPQGVLDLAEAEGVTVLKCVPTQLHRLIEAQESRPRDLSRLRLLLYGAAPITPELLQRAIATFGPILAQSYGQTEAPVTIARLTKDDHGRAATRPELLRSVGQPYRTVEVKVVDAEGRERPVGEPGEVHVRGPMVAVGYVDPEGGSPVDAQGFVATGDIGYLDADGYLFLVDRANSMIITGGYNVYPGEVEPVLAAHDEVRAAAVVGRQDEEWGEVVVAYVVLEAGASPTADTVERLREHCRARLARYKVPREIRFVPALPETVAGKVDRAALSRGVHDVAE